MRKIRMVAAIAACLTFTTPLLACDPDAEQKTVQDIFMSRPPSSGSEGEDLMQNLESKGKKIGDLLAAGQVSDAYEGL